MTVNFKKLQEYPIDINNFSYDVEAMVNNIYVGPQGELLEQLNHFNTHYDTNIEVTKNFTLKPGGYNKLKEAYSKWVLRWDMKPNGISSIFNRIREHGWRYNGFKDDATNLERTMASLRSSGLQWQDNTDNFSLELERTKANIINSLEKCKELYPNVAIEVKMIPMSMVRNPQGRHYGNDRRSLPALRNLEDISTDIDYCVTFVLYIKNPTMTVHILRSNETIEQIETSCSDIIVASGASLLQMIGRSWGRQVLQHGNAPSRTSRYHLEAIYLDSMNTSKHPYISGVCDKYAYELDGEEAYCGNICTGNMFNEFRNTIINTQIEAHITYLVTWLTNYYIPQTNPLNRIKLLRRYGQDRQFELLARTGYNAFDIRLEPDQCDFGTKLAQLILEYAKCKRPGTYNALTETIQRGTTEYDERTLEYIQNVNVDDFPCNTCTYNLDCDHQTNIMLLFRLEVLEPMEEAYIGMFLEMHELHAFLHNGKPIVFIEQLVHDSFRWKIDEEYDKLIECNYIAQIFVKNEIEVDDTFSWSNRRYLDVMCSLWGKTDHTIGELYKIFSMNNGCNWDWERLCEFDLGNPKPVAQEHDSITEEALEDLAMAVLTPEELTLRWASRNGGANNL